MFDISAYCRNSNTASIIQNCTLLAGGDWETGFSATQEQISNCLVYYISMSKGALKSQKEASLK